eukprot:11742178-Alexandrium_andersonii.AAC.1
MLQALPMLQAAASGVLPFVLGPPGPPERCWAQGALGGGARWAETSRELVLPVPGLARPRAC